MRSLTRLSVAVLALSLAGVSRTALAQDRPDALVMRVTQDVMDHVKSNKDIQAGMQKPLLDLIDARIIPFVDFQRMTAVATGRAWGDATPQQQQQLVDEFQTVLRFTYGGALSSIKDQKIEYQPLRADPAETEVQVNSAVLSPRGEPFELDYRLEKTAVGWKFYDMNIEGAWLVESYRVSFASEIAKGGIDGLIKALIKINQKFVSHR